MNAARRVTEAEALGETTTADDQATLRQRYEPAYFDIRIPEDQLDRIRLEAREATYRNSQDEAATIDAVDRAVFDRVRDSEHYNLQAAARLVEREERAANKEGSTELIGNAIQRAEALRGELSILRDELAVGRKPTAELAERYDRIRREIRQPTGAGVGRNLVALADRAEGAREKIADPIATVQHTLSRMPMTMWRPLGVRRW